MLDRFLSWLEPELINQASRWPSIAQRWAANALAASMLACDGGGDGGGV